MQRLRVKVTCGGDDAERANQGLTVAATAAASGVDVGLWLTGDAVWLAVADRDPDLGLEHATPARELVATVAELGDLVVCTQCATRRGVVAADLVPGARIAGAAVWVEEVLVDGTQALVY